jgi:hypothetical protein
MPGAQFGASPLPRNVRWFAVRDVGEDGFTQASRLHQAMKSHMVAACVSRRGEAWKRENRADAGDALDR